MSPIFIATMLSVLIPQAVFAEDSNSLQSMITQMKSLCSQQLQNPNEMTLVTQAMMPLYKSLTSNGSANAKKQAWTFMYQYRDCPNAAIRANILRLSRLPFFMPDEKQEFLSERLDDPSPDVRNTLVEILMSEGVRSAEVEILLNLYSQDADPRIRQKAQYARQHLHLQ